MKIKKRLDLLLLEKYPQYSRTQIQSYIMQGKVLVDNQVINKPGTPVEEILEIKLLASEPKYVSRAGFKLEKALEYFNVNPENLVILDAGLSTGGFTDCLLQHNAKKIYGIDVGYGQVHEKIRQDPRVIIMEKTNLRHLTELPEKVGLVTLDLSFISVLKVMPAINNLLKEDGQLLILIKPQFEAEYSEVGKGGIIRDPKVHQKVIQKVTSEIEELGYSCLGVTDSPIEGTSGNKEFLAYFKRNIS